MVSKVACKSGRDDVWDKTGPHQDSGYSPPLPSTFHSSLSRLYIAFTIIFKNIILTCEYLLGYKSLYALQMHELTFLRNLCIYISFQNYNIQIYIFLHLLLSSFNFFTVHMELIQGIRLYRDATNLNAPIFREAILESRSTFGRRHLAFQDICQV